MNFTDTLLGDQLEIKILVLRKLNQSDWWKLISLLINVSDWSQRDLFDSHWLILNNGFDILGCDFLLFIIAGLFEVELDSTLITHGCAVAFLMIIELLDVLAVKRHKTESMGDELIVEG